MPPQRPATDLVPAFVAELLDERIEPYG